MIESLRLLCLLSITENGELSLCTSYQRLTLFSCRVNNCVMVFSHRTPAKRLPVIKSTISTGEIEHVSERDSFF